MLAAGLLLAGSSGGGISVPPPPGDSVPTWSPDASAIVFFSQRDGDSLRVVGPGGDGEHRIPWLPASRQYSFARDWARIAGPAGPFQTDMVVERLDGSDRVDLGAAATQQKPSWSPDGTRLTYVVPNATPNHADVFVARIDGSEVRRISEGVGPIWSPAGSEIAYLAGDYAHSSVHVVRPDGTGDFAVTGTAVGYGEPTWSPDGTRLAVFHRNANPYVYSGTLEVWTVGGNRLASFPFGGSFQLEWAPSGGDRVAYSTGMGVFLLDLATGKRTLAAPFGGDVAWSPDGRQLAFAAGGECRDREGIYRLEQVGTAPMRLTNYCRIVGTAGDDVLRGTANGDVLLGGEGNDRLTAVTGDFGGDTLEGQGGNDVLLGSERGDTLEGGFGNDVLSGGAGPDLLFGGPGRDVLRGEGGRDLIYARDGQRDVVSCGTNVSRSTGPEADIAYVDRIDRVSGCEYVFRPGPAPPVGGPTSLAIRVWPLGNLSSKNPRRNFTLRCRPAGGTLPHAGAACARLARLQNPFAPPSPALQCTWVYDGQQTASVVGVYGGRRVRTQLDRITACSVARWDRLRFLFPLP